MEYNYNQWQTEVIEFWEEANSKKVDYEDKDNIVQKCLCLAFRDLMVRTMVKTEENKNKKIVLDNLARQCYKETELGEKIKRWDENISKMDESSFKDFQKDLCNMVKVFLKKTYEDNCCTYGKSQKIVNMTFKYLYAYHCSNCNDGRLERFNHCHMPLDSFILEWFKLHVLENVEDTKKVGAWSTIEYKDTDKQFGYEYYYEEIKEYCNEIRKQDNLDITPLQAEFVIWKNIKKEMAADKFILAYKKDFEKGKLHEMSLQEKEEMIHELTIDEYRK